MSTTSGWLMTAVAPWGENAEDALDQALVDLGLGDVRCVPMQGAMLPLGFQAIQPRPLPMGSLVECHVASAYAWNGSSACAGVAYAMARTPEGEPCTVVATITTATDFEETTLLLRRNLQRRLASRDLEVESFDLAVDEVTAGRDHHGVAVAALILPDSLSNLGSQRTGPVRKSMTRSAQEAIDAAQRRVDTKAPAARAMRPGNRTDFSL